MFTKIVVTAALLAAGAAHAVVVPGLYNTGVGPGGAPLAAGDGATDGNYVVRAGSPIPGVGAGPASTYFNTAYAAESATSRWISYSGSPFNGSGSFEIETSFDLTGYKASTARITGFWGVDNLGSVLLNRNVTGNFLSGANTSNFTVLHSFTIASNFTAGINTLSILGFDAAITEREQAGRTVYRVRVGPYEQKTQADDAKATLDGNGLETALVRVQR